MMNLRGNCSRGSKSYPLLQKRVYDLLERASTLTGPETCVVAQGSLHAASVQFSGMHTGYSVAAELPCLQSNGCVPHARLAARFPDLRKVSLAVLNARRCNLELL